VTRRRPSVAVAPPLVVLPVGLAAVLLAAPAAWAAVGSITSPVDGAHYDTAQVVTVAATVAGNDAGRVDLSVSDPRVRAAVAGQPGCTWTLISRDGAGALAKDLDLAAAYDASCDPTLRGRPAANGGWQLTLTASGVNDSRTFTTAVPPAAPTGVRTASAGPGRVTVSWAAPAEPDTHAYAVLDEGGQVLDGGRGETTALCSADTCSATVTVPAGRGHSASVEALRRRNPEGAGADLTATSAPVPLAATAGSASPSASATPPAGGSQGTGAGAAPGPTAGASAAPRRTPTPLAAPTFAARPRGARAALSAEQRRRQDQQFAALAVKPSLPPLPGGARQTVGPPSAGPVAAPQDEGQDGPFSRTLGYTDLTQEQQRQRAVPLAGVADAVGLSPAAFWRSIALSLLLLLGAGHARAFASRAPPA
jgi:hypothetical protein